MPIEITNLSHTYDGKYWALENINFKVRAGRVVALVGPSGSGKSTFLRIVNRLVTPSNPGESDVDVGVRVFGQDLLTANRSQLVSIRRRIGIISQQFNLFERQTVVENVLLGRLGYLPSWRGLLYFPRLVYSQKDYELANNILNGVGLGRFEFQRVSNLSGGQKQRVAVARALVQQPKIILADEPVSNLDHYLAMDILDLLVSSVRKRNLTLLVSLHSLELAKQYADEVVGFSKGNIVYHGNPQKVTDGVVERIYGKK